MITPPSALTEIVPPSAGILAQLYSQKEHLHPVPLQPRSRGRIGRALGYPGPGKAGEPAAPGRDLTRTT